MRGFTLIEVLVVMAIIGLLTSLIVPNVAQAQRRAKEAGVKATMHTVQAALESYQLDTASYPEGDNVSLAELLVILGNKPCKNPFTGQEYSGEDKSGQITYAYEQATGEYALTGFGQDGETPILVLTNT